MKISLQYRLIIVKTTLTIAADCRARHFSDTVTKWSTRDGQSQNTNTAVNAAKSDGVDSLTARCPVHAIQLLNDSADHRTVPSIIKVS